MQDFTTPTTLGSHELSPVSIADSGRDDKEPASSSRTASVDPFLPNEASTQEAPENSDKATPEVIDPKPAPGLLTAGVPLLGPDGCLAGYSMKQSLGDRAALYDQQDCACTRSLHCVHASFEPDLAHYCECRGWPSQNETQFSAHSRLCA